MSRTIAARVGDIELLVETTAISGTEPTARLSDAVAGVEDAFARAQCAIVEIAASTAQMIGDTAKRGARPDALEVQFGLKLSAQGNLIVAGTAGEATLQVTLTYNAART